MSYLFDTSICIHIIRKKPAALLQRIVNSPVGTIEISSITVAELSYGVEKSVHTAQNQIALEQFLLPLTIVMFDYQAAVEYGRIRSMLERTGTPIGSFDMLIAAHALSLGSVVVTNNTKEFARIAHLTIEDWTLSE